MNEMLALPDHDSLRSAIDVCDPSELHGQLCGLLCLERDFSGEAWLAMLAADAIGIRDPDALRHLYRSTTAQIKHNTESLALLLPDDEMNLAVRADALGAWCQGLLSGLGLAGLPQLDLLSEQTREFLNDVSQIANVGLDGDNPDESDELAYVEIVEYLRVGLLYCIDEFDAAPSLRVDHPPERLH